MWIYIDGAAVSNTQCLATLLAKAQSGLLYRRCFASCWIHHCCWLLCTLSQHTHTFCNLVKQASPLPHACTEIASMLGLKFVVCVVLMRMLHSQCILTKRNPKSNSPNRNQETAKWLLPEPACSQSLPSLQKCRLQIHSFVHPRFQHIRSPRT